MAKKTPKKTSKKAADQVLSKAAKKVVSQMKTFHRVYELKTQAQTALREAEELAEAAGLPFEFVYLTKAQQAEDESYSSSSSSSSYMDSGCSY